MAKVNKDSGLICFYSGVHICDYRGVRPFYYKLMKLILYTLHSLVFDSRKHFNKIKDFTTLYNASSKHAIVNNGIGLSDSDTLKLHRKRLQCRWVMQSFILKPKLGQV